jgi:hypothetical protein
MVGPRGIEPRTADSQPVTVVISKHTL